MKRLLAIFGLGLAATGAHAEHVDVNLSNDVLRGVYAAPFPRMNGIFEIGGMLGESHGEKFQMAHAAMLVTGDAGARDANVNAGLGGRVFVLNAEDVDGGGLALGGTIDARLPAFNRLGVVAYAYGAPDASLFGDFDGYYEYAVSFDYKVLQTASVYLGWRQLKVDVDGAGTATVDTGFHFGLRLNF